MAVVPEDLRLAVWSFFAVATSPVMPNWQAYRELVERDGPRAQPLEPVAELRRALGAAPLRPSGSVARIVASLVSFTDDHAEPVPAELFPRQASASFLEHVASASAAGRVLGRVAQLELAMALTGEPFEALAVCHAATRQLARGRDCRALGITVPAPVCARCEAGRAIAAFPAVLSAGGDPLGDTYHYWANVIAGVTAAHLRGLRGAAIERLFHAGPTLMSAVREGLFERHLFYGNHQHIDRLGLAHGLALGA